MSKNIIVCSDGTGQSGGKGNVTNIWRIFEAINRDSRNTIQVAFYDDGVGTESFKPVKALGGAFGYGLARNVKQLYTEICRTYEPGDKIYYFGFSRGAFTVRTLMGWIMEVGLIDPKACMDSEELDVLVANSYKVLRSQFKTIPQRLLTSDATSNKHKEKLKGRSFDLNEEQKQSLGYFIGIWDTVDAVGFPVAFLSTFWNSWIHQFKFPNYALNENVRNAYHALAIDDERLTFHPQPWDEKNKQDSQNLQQVWFSGMHSNVGGGYPQDGMAYVSLNWIMGAAVRAGLEFTEGLAVLYRERANSMEKMYNSRSGLGAYYRYSPRNLRKISDKYNLKHIVIHYSVLSRTEQSPSGYTPRNLPNIFRVCLPSGNVVDDESGLNGSLNMQLKAMKRSDVIEIGSSWDTVRTVLQWFVVSFTVVFGVAALIGIFCERDNFFARFISGAAPEIEWPVLAAEAVVLLALTFLLSLLAEKNSNRDRSRFWMSVLRKMASHQR